MNNKLHLAPKYDRIFVGGRYLFLKLEENCELRGTDYVQGRISEHIFAPNGGYRTYYPSNLFHNERGFENWGIFSDNPQFHREIFDHVRERKYLMDSKLVVFSVTPFQIDQNKK